MAPRRPRGRTMVDGQGYRKPKTEAEGQMTETVSRVPIVDYLVLGEAPRLVAHECGSCGARYFDRRNACARCFATDFVDVDVATEGELRAFTIVELAAPGIEVPFVAGVVECDGTSVRANVINCPPDPEHVTLGMRLRLTTYSMGTDDNGVEAIGFGFEPVDRAPEDDDEHE
jgi:uncharacterized OB-fold protein